MSFLEVNKYLRFQCYTETDVLREVLVLITVLQNNMPLFVLTEFSILSILGFFSFCFVSFLDLTASMA